MKRRTGKCLAPVYSVGKMAEGNLDGAICPPFAVLHRLLILAGRVREETCRRIVTRVTHIVSLASHLVPVCATPHPARRINAMTLKVCITKSERKAYASTANLARRLAGRQVERKEAKTIYKCRIAVHL